MVLKQGPDSVKGETNFSEKYWGPITHDYAVAANKLKNTSKEYIFQEARYLSKLISSHHRDEPSHTPVVGSSLGFRAKLTDIV